MPFVLRITDHWNRSACQVRGARKRSDSIQHAIQPIIGSAQRNWQSQPCQGRKTGRARGHRDEEAFQPRATTGGPLASTRVSTVHPFEGTRKARSQAWQETFRHHEEKQRGRSVHRFSNSTRRRRAPTKAGSRGKTLLVVKPSDWCTPVGDNGSGSEDPCEYVLSMRMQ
ncbi:uncharacterized protein LOC109622709 [Aedes albopictus]|uniref:Secreted protein n=1 Tax=Aedes albopictus TaxID=7160 RepID=A0ABM1ZZZ1_AEDAL